MAYFLPETAPSERDLTAKNRVWGFFAKPNKTRLGNRRQAQQPRRKNRPSTTPTASGVFFYGYRYFDPNTGRWPSRDPIGEEGGINLYGMLHNELVNDADILGLEPKRDCKFTIRAGHGSLNPKMSPVETGAPKPEAGNRCTAVSCYSELINKRLSGAVPYNGQTLGFLPGDQTAYTALENAIEANKKQAEQDCSTNNCGCKTITVRVECPGGAGMIDFQGLATKLKKRPLCGQTYTFDCKRKVWK